MQHKEVFAENLKRKAKENGKSRKDISEDLNLSYFTVTDWFNGKKMPRMDKVEKLATYFGCLKSDLIEDKQKQSAQSELSLRKREFMQKVEGMTDAEIEKLERILALVENKEI